MMVADLNDEDARGPGRGIDLATGPGASQRADIGALARRALHGQARQRDVTDQSGDGTEPGRAMGLQDRSAALPRQFLHRRRASPGKSSSGSAATSRSATDCFGSTAATAVAGRPTSTRRPAAVISTCRLAARRLRPQGSRNLSGGPRTQHGRRGRCRAHANRSRHRRRRPDARRAGRQTGRQLFMCGGCYFIYDRPQACPTSLSRQARRSPRSRRTGDVPIAAPTRPPSVPMSSRNESTP